LRLHPSISFSARNSLQQRKGSNAATQIEYVSTDFSMLKKTAVWNKNFVHSSIVSEEGSNIKPRAEANMA
jgi:hypothetical protein